MIHRLFHIYRTYWTRPLCLLLTLLLLFCFGMLAYESYSDDAKVGEVVPNRKYAGPISTFQRDEFQSSVPRRREAEVRTLWVSDADLTSVISPEQFHNVECISWEHTNISVSDAEFLLKFPKLHSVELACRQISSGVLRTLAPRIEELQIPSHLLLEHQDELSSLEKVRQLRVDQSRLTADSIAGMSTIPNLQTIVFDRGLMGMQPIRTPTPNINKWGKLHLPLSAFAPLIRHPHLREVFADWSPQLLANRKFLTEVHGYPATFPKTPTIASVTVIFTMIVLSALLAVQLGAQFLSPSAMVIPNYGRPHKLAALLLLAATAGVATCGLMSAQVAFLPALSISLLIPSSIAVILRSVVPSAKITKQEGLVLVLRFAVILAMAVFLFNTIYCIAAFPSPALLGLRTWYFAGHYPIAAIGIICIELAILCNLFIKLERYLLRVTEAQPKLTAAFIFHSREYRRTQQTALNPLAAWGLDGRFQHLSFHRGSFWQQVKLMRWGNPYRPIILLTTGSILFGFFLLFFQMISPQSGEGKDQPPNPLFLFHLFTGQLSVLMLTVPISSWFQRCKSLEMEFCHPFNRRTLSRLLFTSLAIDQSFAIIPATAFSTHLLTLPQVSNSATTLPITSILFITVFSFCHFVGATTFAFRSTWPFYLSSILGFICLFVGTIVVLLIFFAPTLVPQISAEILLGGLSAFTLGLWAAILWLMKKTREREWG
ncbi:hypothetical protein [Planctomicrobium sp. SH527]|uniref:hypothetical protein n=1 Tax=Planctomicrobium sp. SH527 TaxID=3448123 RepID=UPI003F5BCC2A